MDLRNKAWAFIPATFEPSSTASVFLSVEVLSRDPWHYGRNKAIPFIRFPSQCSAEHLADVSKYLFNK